MKHCDFVRPLIWMLLILQMYSYAPAPWRTVSIYNPASDVYQDTVLDYDFGSEFLYSAVLIGGPPVDSIELKKWEPYSATVVNNAVYNIGSLLTHDVRLIPLNTQLLMTYEESGIQYLRKVKKSDLSIVSTSVVSQKPSGIYL